MSEHNRRRALADLVSLDAWKGKPDAEGRFTLHADVAFGQARVGGGVEEKARFRLTLKRAEVVVIVPATEPAKVVKAMVMRGERAEAKVKESDTRTSARQLSANAGVRVGLKQDGADVGVSAGAAAKGSSDRRTSTSVTRSSGPIDIVQSKTFEGDYRWIVTPVIEGEVLDGHPWDAVKKPRLTLRDTRKDRTKGIEPGVRVQVRCMREDLVISDIVLKDARKWNLMQQAPLHRNRVVAAEAVIRDRLATAGLFHGELGELYAEICLAEIVVGEDE